jgi:3-methyladenine DNA glycosylase AlkD
MTSTWLRKIRGALVAVADAEKAPQMQAYMKSAMPYHGVPAPVFKGVCRDLFAAYAPVDAAAWRRDVLGVWREARFREERYAAIALSGHRAARTFQTLDALPMYEELIVTGAWWDYVDSIAESRVGKLLVAYPKEMRKTMLAWSTSPDMWKRRTSIICQLKRREETDLDLLYRCIEPSIDSKEFFLRKAIGWALRQLAWTDPEEVVRYVAANEARLSGLSRREALKNVEMARVRPRRPGRARGTSSRRRART